MIDTQHVMYDIERCISNVPDACRDCSHYTGTVGFKCMENLMTDALALLKEQDDLGAELTNAVELIHKKNERIKELLKEQEAVPVIQREVMHMLVWCCGSCGVAVTDGDKFCRNCGRKMKWDA